MQLKTTKENWQRVEFISSAEVSDAEDIIMIESPAVSIKILLRLSKKKNIIFEEIAISPFISRFIFYFCRDSNIHFRG